jgi:putative sterol carrier protein
MTQQEFVDKLRRHDAWLPGKIVKLDFGDDGVVCVDGVAGRISEDDEPSGTVIGISWADWLALSEGQLDPMRAYMSGRLRVQGDVSDAMELGSLFKRLKAQPTS